MSHKMERESQQGIYDSDAIAFGKALKILWTLQNVATRLGYHCFRESTQVYIPINFNVVINKEKLEIASQALIYFVSVADVVNVNYIPYGTVSELLY